MSNFKPYDTQAETTYFVRLAQDAKVFKRDPDPANPGEVQPDDVVLTFFDSSKPAGTEGFWVDARLARRHADVGRRQKKGFTVQIVGKLRFKRDNKGNLRGKIYDARLSTMDGFKPDAEVAGVEPETSANESRPAFE